MKKFSLILLILLIACKERKIKFIQSKIYPNLFLIENNPENDSLLKKEITFFLTKNFPKKSTSSLFYKYTSNTKYFLENEEYDGFGAEVLSMYQSDKIASFFILNNTIKRKGELIFYGINNKLYQRDTLTF